LQGHLRFGSDLSRSTFSNSICTVLRSGPFALTYGSAICARMVSDANVL